MTNPEPSHADPEIIVKHEDLSGWWAVLAAVAVAGSILVAVML